jgi:hypothetical protein
MNLIELIFFVAALLLSFVFGKYFYGYIGWWAVIPGLLLGFGIIPLISILVMKIFPKRRRMPSIKP